jgi:hypothetical protein
MTVGLTAVGLVAATLAAGSSALAKGPPGVGGSRPTIEFNKGAQSVAENAGSATITVLREGKSAQLTGPSTVDYATTGGSAVSGATCSAGVDYVPASGTLTFPPTAVSRTFAVTICNEHVYDLNETVNLALSGITDANYGNRKTMVLTITETNAKPVLTIGSAPSVVEGGTALFPVSFNGVTGVGTPVHVTTANGTAIVGTNFTSIGTTYDSTIPAGTYNHQFLGNVAVSTLNDAAYNAPLHFTVVLTATNASVSGSPATGTITDAGPLISVADSSAWQGSSMSLPVTLSYPVPFDVTVHWATVNGTAVGAANCTTNPDYVSSAGNLLIPANTSGGNVSVPTCPPADSQVAAPNTFFGVVLSAPTNGSVGPLADGTIKSTVPYQTTVQANPTSASSDGIASVTETATVANQSGDGLPGVTVRGELYRDFDNDPGELDGALSTSTSPTVLTDANGQVISTYTNPDAVSEIDYLYVCVPGFAGANTNDCGVTAGDEGFDFEFYLLAPTPPSTTGMATVVWTP